MANEADGRRDASEECRLDGSVPSTTVSRRHILSVKVVRGIVEIGGCDYDYRPGRLGDGWVEGRAKESNNEEQR